MNQQDRQQATREGHVSSGEVAQTTTATVELTVVRVGRKQLTQSVYRQLPSVPVIDPEKAQLRGEVWGWVNYHPERDRSCLGAHSPHLHVLWTHEGLLYRSCTCSSPDGEEPETPKLDRLEAIAQDKLVAYVNACMAHGADPFVGGVRLDVSKHRTLGFATVRIEGLRWAEVRLTKAEADVLQGQLPEPSRIDLRKTDAEQQEASTRAAQAMREDALGKLPDSGNRVGIYRRELHEAKHEVQRWRERWDKSYRACLDAGQVFIAI